MRISNYVCKINRNTSEIFQSGEDPPKNISEIFQSGEGRPQRGGSHVGHVPAHHAEGPATLAPGTAARHGDHWATARHPAEMLTAWLKSACSAQISIA